MDAKPTGKVRWKEIEDRTDLCFIGNLLGKERYCKLQQEWEIAAVDGAGISYTYYEWHDIAFEH